MGSLMAGWDSRVHDPKAVKFMRNKSLTKDEIDSYWRVKRKTEEEHLKAITPPLTPTTTTTPPKDFPFNLLGDEAILKRSSSMPPLPSKMKERRLDMVEEEEEEDVKKQALKRSSCWWTMSNSAFLNEPPVLMNLAEEERKSSAKFKYTPQHHVSNIMRLESATNTRIKIV